MRIERRILGTPRGAQSRRGGVLVLSLIAVTTVVVLAASFTQFASSVANRQAQAVNRKRAFYVAEAGLAEAYAGLTISKSGNVGTEENPALLGDGVFWVQATELQPNVIKLVSTGMIGTGRAVLGLVVERSEKSVASLGVFAGKALGLPAGSKVDAYDSSLGGYGSQLDHSGATLGSNAGITITGSKLKPTTVDGDVTPGPDLTVTQTGPVNITGSTSPALGTTSLPAIEVPELALGGAQVQSSPYPLVIPSGSSGYQSLSVSSGSQVIIQGPAKVVLGSLALASSAQLSFDTSNGPVELYVTDAMSLALHSLLSTSSTKPENVSIFVPGPTAAPVALRSDGPFYGMVYVPGATLALGANFELFGALVVDRLTFDAAAKLHFDVHLAVLAEATPLPGLLSWRIVQLDSISAELGGDPFTFLGLDRNVLPRPNKAHADQTLAIDYYDAASNYHRYIGLESHFDWTVVKTVILAIRDGVEAYVPTSTVKKGAIKSPGVAPIIDGPMI